MDLFPSIYNRRRTHKKWCANPPAEMADKTSAAVDSNGLLRSKADPTINRMVVALMLYINTRKSDSILCFWFISLAFLVPFWFTRKVHQIPAHHSTITFCTHRARGSPFPPLFSVCIFHLLPFWIFLPSILSSSSMGLSILAVVKRLLCRMECEKWKCRQRKYTRK